MSTQTRKRKRRIWTKRRLKLAKPVKGSADRGVSLRLISECDHRLAVVKEMRRRLEQLKDDAGLDSIQQEWLAARAVFMVARIESLEVAATEGSDDFEWGAYLQAVNCLSGVLGKLGIDRKLIDQSATLEEYVESKMSKREKRKAKQVR